MREKIVRMRNEAMEISKSFLFFRIHDEEDGDEKGFKGFLGM